MKYNLFLAATILLAALTTGCKKETAVDPAAGAPQAAKVEEEGNADFVKVKEPAKFEIATAEKRDALPSLSVTAVVNADVSRNVPVISLASGRILEVKARLGDSVTKGQLLLRVQSADVSAAFSDYRQAVADAALSKTQLQRSKILFEKGAIAQKDLEVAEDVEAKARVTVETAVEHLKVLGVDKDKPTAIVDVFAPASGVITDQQVTAASGTQGLAAPNAFTISDLSHVWIVCDVFENDMPFIHIGEYAEVRLNAYPEKVIRARVSNIAPVLDPNLRTAKVRLEVDNPGYMRLGMFAKATFQGAKRETRAMVPATAVLHLHDRDWVYQPMSDGRFRRVEVKGGDMLPGNMQEILSGLQAGDKVVKNALVLQNTEEQ